MVRGPRPPPPGPGGGAASPFSMTLPPTTETASDEAERLWIVVPAYCEGERVGTTLDKLLRQYARVVVVDDGSSDETYDIAARRAVWLLRHPINCGQGAALQTGIDFALAKGAEVIVTFDGDGQHSVDDIARIAEPVLTGRVDVALGSRFLGNTVDMPWTRWLVLKAGVLFTRVVSRIKVTDTHNGLRALSRTAATRIRITQNRMAHASEILDQVHARRLRVCEVPVTIRYNAAVLDKGQSSAGALRIAAQFLFGKLTR